MAKVRFRPIRIPKIDIPEEIKIDFEEEFKKMLEERKQGVVRRRRYDPFKC